jgi:hypothetical protein
MPDQKPSRLTEDRFPGYDVLSKRLTPSWNEKTREVVTRRLAIDPAPKFFSHEEFETLRAIADRIVPQPPTRPPIPVAALVDEKLHRHNEDGFRKIGMPRQAEAWRRGLAALDQDAKQAFGARFRDLSAQDQDDLLARMEKGLLRSASWANMPSDAFFKMRMAHDIVRAYYAHPTAWSEVGWGGPASPRGYVRMDFNERDSWEAAEVKDGDVAAARRKNLRVG